ncbi:imidazole glycerol phosphate synthase subunit HisH [Pleionea litopenaei]|uniref:Imidazole glycerol phosphate synthase subunit HisH n=1 Tax=Pleionea litopenaei TaxID=3070815 RepID=A0AA51X6L4_9GAMM|nr:imidazole glycerol phosphate synthase subunit HisH [Pleionea sp. HL-JVS1]WMS87412.1 imidazole glycerol phosphate synthase subunit HisH [Pleionea sp. HL-JVS1]
MIEPSKAYTVTIIDTKAGNIFSLKACLQRLGCEVMVAKTPAQVVGDRLIIPGQGHFGSVMQQLTTEGWLSFLNQWKSEDKYLLGICVGMQVFFEQSEESPGVLGLGWLDGKVKKLNSPKQPMVGWSSCQFSTASFESGMPYFVNSYAIKESQQCIATTSYGETFCAAVKLNNLVGFQFHPEKSSHYGSKLVAQALNLS